MLRTKFTFACLRQVDIVHVLLSTAYYRPLATENRTLTTDNRRLTTVTYLRETIRV